MDSKLFIENDINNNCATFHEILLNSKLALIFMMEFPHFLLSLLSFPLQCIIVFKKVISLRVFSFCCVFGYLYIIFLILMVQICYIMHQIELCTK